MDSDRNRNEEKENLENNQLDSLIDAFELDDAELVNVRLPLANPFNKLSDAMLEDDILPIQQRQRERLNIMRQLIQQGYKLKDKTKDDLKACVNTRDVLENKDLIKDRKEFLKEIDEKLKTPGIKSRVSKLFSKNTPETPAETPRTQGNKKKGPGVV